MESPRMKTMQALRHRPMTPAMVEAGYTTPIARQSCQNCLRCEFERVRGSTTQKNHRCQLLATPVSPMAVCLNYQMRIAPK